MDASSDEDGSWDDEEDDEFYSDGTGGFDPYEFFNFLCALWGIGQGFRVLNPAHPDMKQASDSGWGRMGSQSSTSSSSSHDTATPFLHLPALTRLHSASCSHLNPPPPLLHSRPLHKHLSLLFSFRRIPLCTPLPGHCPTPTTRKGKTLLVVTQGEK